MMKVLILGFTKLRFMPYACFYLDRLDAKKHEIHLLCWNRDGLEDIPAPSGIIVHVFGKQQLDEVDKRKKVMSFILYRRFALQLMRKQCFDRIIILHSLPGLLVYEQLVGKYKNRYLLDYRDHTYETNHFFQKAVFGLVRNSFATFVSSKSYLKYLPQLDKILISHNLLMDSLNYRNIGKLSDKVPIVISFWGLIRHYRVNEQIVKQISNDRRFELHYYGREQDTAQRLKELTVTLGSANVFFHGEYKPADRYTFAGSTSLLHNIYDADDVNTNMAMGNKYYDGIVFGIPQLCIKGSYMGDIVSECGVGLPCDPFDSGFLDVVHDYYTSLNREVFLAACEKQIAWILQDLAKADEVVSGFVGGGD